MSAFACVVGELPRIGQVGQDLLVSVQRLDRRLVGDRQHDHVAPFLALADREQPRAGRRRLRERLEVALHVLVVGELVGHPRDASEELERGGHGRRRRQVIDQLGEDPRVLRVLLDLRGVFLVDDLRLRRAPLLLRLVVANRGNRKTDADSHRQRERESKEPVTREPGCHAFLLTDGFRMGRYGPCRGRSTVTGRTVAARRRSSSLRLGAARAAPSAPPRPASASAGRRT